MELGSLDIQVFIGLVMVLGAALVALICDYLKGNNEQLRERNIELRVRTEELERFVRPTIPVAGSKQAEESWDTAVEPAHPAAPAPEVLRNWDVAAAASRARLKQKAEKRRSMRLGETGLNRPKRRDLQASADDIPARAELKIPLPVYRPGLHIVSEEPSAPKEPTVVPPVAEVEAEAPVEVPPTLFPLPKIEVLAPVKVAEQVAPVEVLRTEAEPVGLTVDVESMPVEAPIEIIAEEPSLGPAETLSPAAPVQATSGVEIQMPTGMVDRDVFIRLLELPDSVSKIVVTVSLSDTGRESDRPASLLPSITTLLRTMLRDGDMGAHVTDQLWVLVFPLDERKGVEYWTSKVSEKLWDFQLRHLDLSGLSFSWAGVDVRDDRLINGVQSAMERMETSRRGKRNGVNWARTTA